MKPMYQMLWLSWVVGLGALNLTACSDGGSSSVIKPTPTTNPAQLRKTASEDELTTYLRTALLERYGKLYNDTFYYPTAVADLNQESSGVSNTNTQEVGVDEADRFKTDGQYLYATSVDSPTVLVFKPDAGSVTERARLKLPTLNEAGLSGLYVAGQTLVALSRTDSYGIWLPDAPVNLSLLPNRPLVAPSSQLFLLDISRPEQPTQQTSLTLDGELVSSRLIGSTLYVALRYTPVLSGLQPYPTTEAAVAQNRTLINQASLKDFLPNYIRNNQAVGELFQGSQCFLTPYSDSNGALNLIGLVALDIKADKPTPTGQCFVGDAETLYASTQAIYLATTQYHYTSTNGLVSYEGSIKTDIHKFALSNQQINYSGSGRVDGHLGWYQDLKSFRFGEYNNVLSVLTYTGEQVSSANTQATLYNLKENTTTQSLDIIAKLPNTNRPAALGKPGEQIYASRFTGKRGYLVTYRLTDPLYILDLSNPTDPQILSELEIEGYSDYLHPVGDTLLLGIGKDAIADSSGDQGRGAWYQGVKVSLIDVTNPQTPFEKERLILGKRGSDTAVSQTHHALTSIKAGNEWRFALPLSRHETPETYTPIQDAASYYAWTQDELVRLTVDAQNGTLTQLPSVIAESSQGGDMSYSTHWAQDRSIYMNGYIYYLHKDKVLGSAW